jgi:hypothetical protein
MKRKSTPLKVALRQVPPGRHLDMLAASTAWLHDKHPAEFAALAKAQHAIAANPGVTLAELKKKLRSVADANRESPDLPWSDEQINDLWPQAAAELERFKRFLAQKSGLTAKQLDMALQLASAEFARRKAA